MIGVMRPRSAAARALEGFHVVDHGSWVHFWHNGSVAFRDCGDVVEIDDVSFVSVLAAMQLARSKFGTLVIHGPDSFKAQCVALAVVHGFDIKNPELQEDLARAAALRVEARLNAPTGQDLVVPTEDLSVASGGPSSP